MKILTVLGIMLLAAMLATAAPIIKADPSEQGCSVTLATGMTVNLHLSMDLCSGMSGTGWWICEMCALTCSQDPGGPPQGDPWSCYMDCMASYGYVDFKQGEPHVQPVGKWGKD